MREIRQQPVTRHTREAIARALDGVESFGDSGPDAAYQAAIAVLECAMPLPIERLRLLGSRGLVSAASRFDDVHRLLQLLGVDAIPTSAIPAGHDWPGLIVVGCQRLNNDGQYRWFEQMLVRGAIAVTSDCTATVPVIAGRLRLARRRPASRARLARVTTVGGSRDSQQGWLPLPAEYHPAVRLSPGHLPLARQHRSVTVLASNPLTKEPLVVLAAAGGGQVLHSVAHWWQESEPDTTEIGQRRLAEVPVFAEIGHTYPEARFGAFSAALALVMSLLSGLDLALDRAGIVQPAAVGPNAHDHEGESLGATA